MESHPKSALLLNFSPECAARDVRVIMVAGPRSSGHASRFSFNEPVRGDRSHLTVRSNIIYAITNPFACEIGHQSEIGWWK
jgi:hypothetical protein